MKAVLEDLLEENKRQSQKIDAFQFWTFFQLQARNIVSSRTDLHRKQKYFGFPKAIHLASGRRPAAVFRVVDVIAWVESRVAAEAAE